MKLFLDSANLNNILECATAGIIDGVTVNQSLLAKEPKCDPRAYFWEITQALMGFGNGADRLSLPYIEGVTTADWFDGLYEKIADEVPQIAVKVPVAWANVSLISELAKHGHFVNATCVFSVYQADIAVRAGASIISAFVGRMNDIEPNYGYKALTAIKKRHPDFTVLAGSIRTEEMVAKVEECGADVATVPKSVLEAMANETHSTMSAEKFNEDFRAWAASE